MPNYKAPLRDMHFALNELWNIRELLTTLPAYQDIDSELLEPILEEAAKIAENELFPLNQVGDQQGCVLTDEGIKTPDGFPEAYRHFVEGGWVSLNADPTFGGQGLPKMIQVLIDEMLCSSNIAFSLYTVLTQGAYHAVHQYASEELKKLFLPKLVSGEWSGTMCLTESHCGTDLGLLRTKADPIGDGTYKITGTKIFITSGDHDLTDNIIHMVLARLPDAPPGIKGISLFLVPKYLVTPDGELGERNGVNCSALEHKMGIKGSSTCVMNFEDAEGYLIGQEHKGMPLMFTMMNLERINIGLQGLGLAEVAYQNARDYAKERLQGRSPKGAECPDKPADPLIVHPDVRRMLLTMKAYNEAARALTVWVGMQVDISKHHPDEKTRTIADDLTALLTPVIKAFFSDYGFNACNLGLQILGGHGYITELGMEQYVRDARIAQIYEGANGIQALDLVKRKLIMSKGESIHRLIAIMDAFIDEHIDNIELQEFINPLTNTITTLKVTSKWILRAAEDDPAAAGAASYDYLTLLGLIVFAFMWAQMASVAITKTDSADKSFYEAKLQTGRFFMARLLPQIEGFKNSIMSGSNTIMAMSAEDF